MKYPMPFLIAVTIFSIIVFVASTVDIFELTIQPEITTAKSIEKSKDNRKWMGYRRFARIVHFSTTLVEYNGTKGNLTTQEPIEIGKEIRIQYSKKFKTNCVAIPEEQNRPYGLFELLWLTRDKWLYVIIILFVFDTILLFKIFGRKKKPDEAELWLDAKAKSNMAKRKLQEEDDEE